MTPRSGKAPVLHGAYTNMQYPDGRGLDQRLCLSEATTPHDLLLTDYAGGAVVSTTLSVSPDLNDPPCRVRRLVSAPGAI